MPVKPVIVDTSIVAVGDKPTAYQNIGIIGQDAGGTASDNEVQEITTLADVATLFGATSDIYYAAQQCFNLGVKTVWCIRATATEEVAESVTEGTEQTLAQPVTVTGRVTPVAGTASFLGFKYDDPLTVPGTDEFVVNSKTGKVFFEGAVTDTITYTWVDWQTAFDALTDYTIRLVILADSPANEDYYGDLDDLLTMGCDVYGWVTAIMSEGTGTQAEIQDDLTKYSSKNAIGVAHKDASIDVAAIVVAKISQIEPWDKMMWKQIPNVTMSSYWTSTEVDTFEAAKCNAIIKKGDYDLLSDGLTLAGGTYKFIDITRTQYYVEDNIIAALESLIQNTAVPYTPAGLNIVKSTIANICQEAVAVGALISPYLDSSTQKMKNGYTVEMPVFSSIAAADKTNRQLNGVYVTVWLAGHIQAITINLEIQL